MTLKLETYGRFRIPKGWRKLSLNEVIRSTDRRRDDKTGEWLEAIFQNGIKVADTHTKLYIRKTEAKKYQ